MQLAGASKSQIRNAIAVSLARAFEQDPAVMCDLMGAVLKRHMLSGNAVGTASLCDALDEVQLMIATELGDLVLATHVGDEGFDLPLADGHLLDAALR